jgi:hypothetical protein
VSRVARSRTQAAVLAAVFSALASAAAPARAADPGIGECLSAAESSLKLRSDHKLRAARAQLLVCTSQSCPLEVRQECVKRIDEVNAASPTIVLAVKTPAGRDIAAVKVTVDGQVVAEHLDGSAIAIDPGSHEFSFEVQGEATVTQTIILHEGEKERRETVVIGKPAEAPTAVVGPPGAPAPAPESPASGSSVLRPVGLVIGGVGVAGIGVGAVFGALASSAWKSATRDCSSHTNCSPSSMNEHNTAVTDATISTVAFIAGGVLAAGGVTLFFIAPSSPAATVGLRATPGGLLVTGEF